MSKYLRGGPVFLQWKGTNACLDLTCIQCNKHSHYDGFFATLVQCPYCQAVHHLSHFPNTHLANEEDLQKWDTVIAVPREYDF